VGGVVFSWQWRPSWLDGQSVGGMVCLRDSRRRSARFEGELAGFRRGLGLLSADSARAFLSGTPTGVLAAVALWVMTGYLGPVTWCVQKTESLKCGWGTIQGASGEVGDRLSSGTGRGGCGCRHSAPENAPIQLECVCPPRERLRPGAWPFEPMPGGGGSVLTHCK